MSKARVSMVKKKDGAKPDARNARIARALARWFAASRRELPWRGEPGEPRDPYVVLVSELMLQQTQVSRVLEKFGPFMRAFPTIAALASASEDQVLALWSGLGYYRRARLLHAAARAVVSDHAGVMPETAEGLRTLPGVGPYTAGAIASMAFGKAAALVDGNVARVLTRVEGQDLSAGPDGLAWAWPIAGSLVADAAAAGVHPGVLNEALMELGATVCRPGVPACSECPIRASCAALAMGWQAELPRPKAAPARKRLRLDALVITREDGAVLMEKQGDQALWAGLWQPPTAAGTGRALAAALRTLATALGAQPSRVGVVERTLTHREIEFVVWAAPVRGTGEGLHAAADAARLRWMLPDELDRVGISSACVALLAAAVG